MSKLGKIFGYIVGVALVLCILHMVAHVVAYLSVNFGKYVLYMVVLQVTLIVISICLGKYVKTEYFINVLGVLTWLYIYNHGGTYWQYYYYMWVIFCLSIVLTLGRKYVNREDI